MYDLSQPNAAPGVCRKCKGTGVSNKVLKVKDQVMLAPAYHDKNDVARPQYENCGDCDGSGLVMLPPPTTILQEGEKQQLSPEEARQRYAMA